MDVGHRPIDFVSKNSTGMPDTGPALRTSLMSGRACEYCLGLAICPSRGDPYFHYMRHEQGIIYTTACAGCSLANGLGNLLDLWPLDPREIQQTLMDEVARCHEWLSSKASLRKQGRLPSALELLRMVMVDRIIVTGVSSSTL